MFGHFGSGTFLGVPTYLSQFFVCNPILFMAELEKLSKLDIVKPEVYAHPACLVTSFADMMINQAVEDARGDKRHGSCGVGVNETINRSEIPHLKITMADLWNGRNLDSVLEELGTKWAKFRIHKELDNLHHFIEAFKKTAAMMAEWVTPSGIQQCEDPVFEGAQGLLLDQNNKEYFPHLTRSNTGLANVRTLCEQAGIDEIEAYYVSRTYLTRHGAGPLPGEDPDMRFEDETNLDHPYQARLRFAPLDDGLVKRIVADNQGATTTHLVMTHCDQLPTTKTAAWYVSGPTRDHFEENMADRTIAA